ncbi:hypothetical protein QLQ12_24415 [Actinoplanes sp. NEAU-A12]|uniref:WD40 repeat domain-containing protein n=1 Tax=Actinoplanes sandaracinus TaxID=3045177 RepID=A0ABT6WPV3_9ACTN|nr:hypothetical protein [Actinoplanes sandaracinus]MDI6101770.1 hypothetical protein [Actinoplanes sandaracinus]
MPEGIPLTDHQLGLRARVLAAPLVNAPEPWSERHQVAVGGLLGAGFAVHPESGRDLLLIGSHDGLGLFDTVTGERLARERDGDAGWPGENPGWPEDDDLTCVGIGPIAGTRVRMAGLLGGGLRTVAPDGWSVEVVSPDWPHDRVLLSKPGHDPWSGDHGDSWWHIFHANVTELRAAGFSPSGATLVVATSSDVTLWHR